MTECTWNTAAADIVCQHQIISLVVDKLFPCLIAYGIEDKVDVVSAIIMYGIHTLILAGKEHADMVAKFQ